jgi:hypothetical protein
MADSESPRRASGARDEDPFDPGPVPEELALVAAEDVEYSKEVVTDRGERAAGGRSRSGDVCAPEGETQGVWRSAVSIAAESMGRCLPAR